MDMEETVTKLAIRTRVFTIILQYICNIMIPDHDAGVFLYLQSTTNSTVIDKVVHHILGGFVRWDAQYFMHIARYGYTYENTLAFFPLYPLTVRLIASGIYSIFPLASLDSILLLVFIGFNFILFIMCARLLFKLTAIFFDDKTAYKSTILFCVNPASIFFSAPYSECIFFYLTLLSVLNCVGIYKKYNTKLELDYCYVLRILPIALSCIVRSNGVLNIGFLVYTHICLYILHWPKKNFIRKTIFILLKICNVFTLIITCLIPFIIYQVYCYSSFCSNFHIELDSDVVIYAEKNNFVLPGRFLIYNQSWCYNKIPLAYSYVQKHYWDVGFLKYYELKQLPNFLLALPIFIILLENLYQHIKCSSNRTVLGIFTFCELFNKNKVGVLGNPIINVFVVHISFLMLFCVLFVHIQVSTRLLCSTSPILYWFCASSFKNRKFDDFNTILCRKMSFQQYVIVVYFLSYLIVGTVMFCNFLPWT